MRKIHFLSILLILFLSIPVSGQSWSISKRLTWTANMSIGPSLATTLNTGVHVVWVEEISGNYEIFYKRSTDDGTTWTAPTRLSWNSGNSEYPDIATDLVNEIHVVWHDDTPPIKNELFYKRSTDGGATWSGLKRLTWNTGESGYPSIAVGSSGVIHLVWGDHTPGNREIFYKQSTDSGITWSGSKRLTWSPDGSDNAVVACNLVSGIHVAWVDYKTGNAEIFYKRSTDGGTTWSAPKGLSWNSGLSWEPTIAVNTGYGVHVAWYDYTPGSPEIFYKRSTDGGNTWSGLIRMTWNPSISQFPSIATDSTNGVHLTWHDKSPGNLEILYKKSTNGGTTWSGVTRLTWTSGSSGYPSMAINTVNGIHVAWQDETPGNREIFYKNYK